MFNYNRTPVGRTPPQPPSRGPAPPMDSGRRVPPSGVRRFGVEKSPGNEYIFGNKVAVSPMDFPRSRDGSDIYVQVNGAFVFTAAPLEGFPQGRISFNDAQRSWAQIAVTDMVEVEFFDPFALGGQAYLGTADLEIGFAGRKTTETPYDQDELAANFIRQFQNQIFAPGQQLLMDYKAIPLRVTIRTVQIVDLSRAGSGNEAPTVSDPRARGILTTQSSLNFFKDARSNINIKASIRRPATNSIIQPNFKFEDMGIGGLDKEFASIFRRAFASRIFPPGLVEKMGIQHVRGMLLYGPPGTGKTLIARQIGKMLNAREPKVINGPEVLNKYVGQSEENIRKLFADAEKEYKEKGEESGLHIIIFDELDAVCKQRGSGAAGGTGVGDSVVNQLLSKLDGVDQLNNILLIGMTNRMDMIDDALLRPGRLEVHMEISLPDEHGRAQILKIHTAKMRENNVIDPDVDLEELAHVTKNFSGAEISGLVKAASSWAFNRHIKVGTAAGISEDVVNMKVKREDFMKALDEVKPAFGVAEEDLSRTMLGGILRFSQTVDYILEQGRLRVNQVRNPKGSPLLSVLLHGPPGAGKTALAAKIALDSEFPFVKYISPIDFLGYTEAAKVSQLHKTFADAYKSPLNIVIIDNIELLIDWVPIGPRFSNAVLGALKTLLSEPPPEGRRLLIMATTTERSVLQQLNLLRSFDSEIPVPTVNTLDELAHVLQQSSDFSSQDISRALQEIQSTTGSDKIAIGIKKILTGIKTANEDTDPPERFAEVMVQAIRTAYE